MESMREQQGGEIPEDQRLLSLINVCIEKRILLNRIIIAREEIGKFQDDDTHLYEIGPEKSGKERTMGLRELSQGFCCFLSGGECLVEETSPLDKLLPVWMKKHLLLNCLILYELIVAAAIGIAGMGAGTARNQRPFAQVEAQVVTK